MFVAKIICTDANCFVRICIVINLNCDIKAQFAIFDDNCLLLFDKK